MSKPEALMLCPLTKFYLLALTSFVLTTYAAFAQSRPLTLCIPNPPTTGMKPYPSEMQAVSTVTYQVAGVTYERELFVSLADQVIVVRLTASKPGSLAFRVSANSPQKVYGVKTERNKLILSGVGGSNDNKVGKVKFQAHIFREPKAER